MEFEEIYKDDYITNFWNERNEILRSEWKTPINMPEEVYRKTVLAHIEITEKYAPTLMLVNTKNAYYNIEPETQDWINEKSEKAMKNQKLKKVAWIVSEDFLAQISFDQIIDGALQDDAFNIQYFTSDDEAMKWLFDTKNKVHT
ncbi:hypothetical protein [Flammeovirga aprica]|uniref:STAS/SEC14 domain-containing protein n=1 Tax=Flammeovirga aprica JL-4 TaxID=694437 RepID=A0A7X9XB53_9BACT|nr:hypothetical protein [Flammeovirga aprica]NME70289.1 hypothetical protein [Flammeovirga aprica JL-4]